MLLNDALITLNGAESMTELQEIWVSMWPVWTKSLTQVEKRQVLMCKDKRKIEFALEALRRNVDDDDILPVLIVTARAMFADPGALPPAWDELASSELTDMDVVSVEESMFLYAIRLMRSVGTDVIAETWSALHPFWKRRLPVAAFKVLQDEVYERLRPINLQAFRQARFGGA